MEDLVLDLQKQIRVIRLHASVERIQGQGSDADIMEDVAAAFERILLKYTQPAPYVPGYPCSGGWRSTSYRLFSIISHNA